MAAAPSALFVLPPLPALCADRLQSRNRPFVPQTDESPLGGTMRGEKNYCCRGAAGDHISCPSTPSSLASTLLMPTEAISSWSGSGGGLPGGDEDEARLLQLLRAAPDPSEAFQALQAALPRRGGRLGFPRRKEALYRALGRVLVEGGSDEKRLCLQLLSDVLRGQGEAGQLEEAFSLALLPQLVSSLKEENPALRKDALQILHICLKRSSVQVLRTLIQQGLESTDPRLRASTALLLPILLTPEDLLLGLDLAEVIISLARKLGDQEIEEEAETAFTALQQIGEKLGQERFQSYISRLPSALRRHYNRRLESQFGSQVPYYLELETSGFPEDPLPCAVTLSNSNLKFGIIPQELHSRLLDQEDYKNRTQAVEELKQVLGRFNPSSTPHSSLVSFISLLYNLLDDSNFKVVHGTLQVLHLLVIRLGEKVQQFLGPVIAASVKVLADNKLVIKQEYMKIFLKLMKEVGPQQVLCLLLEHLKHKHSRVREEVVNICICSLLTYPSEDFDLPKLSFDLAPALVDSKRRVRQAALEAFAVLASSMGSGKTSILLKAVDTVELQDDGDGVMNAVQARLARKTLPKLTEQGFVEYAVLMPSSAQGRSSHLAQGADADWLLAGNRTQSAHCHCGDHTRDSMQIYGSYSPTICTRRVLSAGKGKNKLPWENEQPGIIENQTSNAKDIEQFSTYDFIPSPKLKPSQAMTVNEDLCFSRKRLSRNLFQNSRDFNPDSLPVCTGTVGNHQTNLSGKCGQLGFSQICSKTGSLDSDLQFLGTPNSHQDKVYTSLNLGNKTQQTFGSQTEHTLPYSGSNLSPGNFILPSYPFSSPRTSPKHTSPLTASPKKCQDNSVNFSNSWPLKSFEGLSKPSTQKKLVNQKSSDPTGRNHGENSQGKPSPVQLTPALVRLPSSRRGLNGTKPVPPIPRGISLLPDKTDLSTVGHKKKEPGDIWKSKKDNLTIALSELNLKEKDLDQEEMQSSLRSLRNSAAKKRAKLSGSTSDLESPDSAIKLDLTMDSPSRSSSPNISSYSESGVYSQESLTSSLSTTPQGKRLISDIFPTLGSKPGPTRLSSAKNTNSSATEQSLSAGIMTSSVSIIGQRMNYGYGCGDFEDEKPHDISPNMLKLQNKEHPRHKQTKGFTGSSSHIQQMSSFDLTSTNTLSEDSVVVVGKGVFGNPNSAPATCSQSVVSSMENEDTFSVKQTFEPPSGIYGRAVQQSIPSYLDAENEKDNKVSISKSTYDKMGQQREDKELFDVKDCEKKEQNPWECIKHKGTEKIAPENLSICGEEVGVSKNESSLENVVFHSPLKGGTSFKKSPSLVFSDPGEVIPGTIPQYKERIPSVTHSPEIMDSSELRPFSKPEIAMTEALRLLSDDDWEKKIEGLNFIRGLAAFHPEILNMKLHEINFAVVQEVKNLRSGVSRAAVVCLSDLFTYLKKSMDQELDTTVKILLHKAGESNTFIREDVDKALKAMVNNVTPARAVISLINGGQSHLHIAVRRCTAQHLSDVVEYMEPERILSGTKDMADRILPAAAKFAQDSSQETRYYGRKMLFLLMCHPNFDKMLEKYVPSKDLPYIKESVKNLRQKGLGELPLDTPSAKGRRSHTGSVGNTRSSSVSRDTLNSAERDITEVREVNRKSVPRNSLESAEYIKVITGLLNAKDFRDRINGIKQLLSDTENNQELVVGNIVKIFDAFKSRLHDPNSKVNLVALETMHKIIPLLRDNLSPIINMLIPAIVDNNLNSKNPGIYAAATNVVQALSQHVDNYLLLQPFCTKAQFLNGKAKQDMTEKLADIVTELYQRKPHATEQKVLVVLWHLLGNMTNSGSLPGAGGNIRTATAKLSKALFSQMGQNLLHQAASQPPHIKKSLEELLDMTI